MIGGIQKMIAFKGVGKDNANRLGQGRIVYKVGETYVTEKSKTVNSGFHCCENPFECLTYYDIGNDKFLMVEAKGSIDEDGDERIACTELTVLEELTTVRFVYEGMKYMVMHPEREKWEQNRGSVQVARNKAKADIIAIARGFNPKAAAGPGGYIGFLIEAPSRKHFSQVGLFKVDGEKVLPDIFYRLRANGVLEVAM